MYKSFEAYINFKDGVGVGVWVGNYLEEFLRFLFRASIISKDANYIELLNFKSNEINLMQFYSVVNDFDLVYISEKDPDNNDCIIPNTVLTLNFKKNPKFTNIIANLDPQPFSV